MTKKDYIKAAELVARRFNADASNSEFYRTAIRDREVSISILVEIFAADNPRFDADRFRSACRGELGSKTKG